MDTSWLAVSFSTAFCMGFCAFSKRCHLSRTSTDGHLMARRFIFHGLLHRFLRILQEMSSVSCLERWTPHGSLFHFPRPFAWVFAHPPRDVICLVPRQMDTSWLA